MKYLFLLLCFPLFVFGEYYSQVGQDRFVNETFFKNFRNGVFLDIGAHDGVSLNNTYFFESTLGWSGLCLEPNPTVFSELQKNRHCACLCACVTVDHDVTKKFLKITGPLDMLSGLIDAFDAPHKTRIDRQLIEFGGSYEIIDVQCYNINHLLESSNITHVHLLSIDTEGGEYEILKNFNFSKCPVDVIAVEDNYHIYPFVSLLENQGFRFVKALEQDLIFVHKDASWTHD